MRETKKRRKKNVVLVHFFCFNILGVFIPKNMATFSSNFASCQILYMWMIAIFHANCQEDGKLRHVVGII